MRFLPREQRGTQECALCGNISENHHAFCANCGADLKRPPAPDQLKEDTLKEDKAEIDAAPPPKREPAIPSPERKTHSQSAEANGEGISSVQLPDETLKVHPGKRQPQPYRKPLHERTQSDSQDDSTRKTRVNSNGQEQQGQAGIVARFTPETRWSFRPPEPDQAFGTTPRALGRSKATGRIAKIALLSLILAVGLIGLSEIYEIDTSNTLDLLLRQLPMEYVRRAELPRPPIKQPEQKENLRDEGQGGSPASPLPQIETSPQGETSIPDDGKATNGRTHSTRPREKSSGDGPADESMAPRRKAMEHAIGRAIQQRAVEGVAVAFVNDTAYLTGAVLSENQKAAAEQAARNVPGVKRVRNSISVIWRSGY